MRLLEGKGVTKYFGGLRAVAGVDFHIDKSEILGLIGPNGAGKTTLFNLISGALPLNCGTIRFKGEIISGLKPHKICKAGLARTFQSVTVFADMPVLMNVLLGSHFGRPGRISSTKARMEAGKLLEFVGLSGMENLAAGDLTLANQKRLEVARALATKPELLLLDELVAGLNPTETGEVMDLVRRIHKQDITILMIEHVMKAIMTICDRIIVLHHGEKIEEGPPCDISVSEKVIEVYLGVRLDYQASGTEGVC